MPINWQDKEVADRILAAIIGSFDGKINCTEVARLYGGEATYNAIENFLRKPKKKALELKAEAGGKDGPAPSPARPHGKKTDASPTKGVKTGRVSKNKKPVGVKIKSEALIEDDVLSFKDNIGKGTDSNGRGSNDLGLEDDGEFV